VKLPRIRMHVCEMASPASVPELERLMDSGEVRAGDVVAVVGKTEGTGLHDDYGRELAHLRLCEILGRRLGMARDDVAERVTIILSGGCFGVLAPHVTVITRDWVEVEGLPAATRLVVGRARTGAILPEEIGRMGEVRKVAVAVREAMADAGVDDPADVHSVMVKGPALTPAGVADATSRGSNVVTNDLGAGPRGGICFANDAAALGVGLALGEVPEPRLSDAAIRRDWDLCSSVASTSAAGELARADVLLMGNAAGSASELRIGHDLIRDPLDADGVRRAIRSAGLAFDCSPADAPGGRVVQVFAKLIVPDDETLRGRRLTLRHDPDASRVAKAIGGVLVASVTGDPAVFVSGGEMNSHQGPAGASPVAAVVQLHDRHPPPSGGPATDGQL
jgi:cyanuric acid amidohydrolase